MNVLLKDKDNCLAPIYFNLNRTVLCYHGGLMSLKNYLGLVFFSKFPLMIGRLS